MSNISEFSEIDNLRDTADTIRENLEQLNLFQRSKRPSLEHEYFSVNDKIMKLYYSIDRFEYLKHCLASGRDIIWGVFPQVDVNGRVLEPIQWQVIKYGNKVDRGGRQFISRRCLISMQLNTSNQIVPYEYTIVRTWLNGEFLNNFFDDYEKSRIVEVRNTNWHNSGEVYGNKTVDRICLISFAALNELTKNQKAKVAFPTPFMLGPKYRRITPCMWWTKTAIATDEYCVIGLNGELCKSAVGIGSLNRYHGVRPTFWMKVY